MTTSLSVTDPVTGSSIIIAYLIKKFADDFKIFAVVNFVNNVDSVVFVFELCCLVSS